MNVLCRALKVSRSGYYEWLKRKPCARAIEDQRLWPKIEHMHHVCREAYGAVRLRNELRKVGLHCSKHRIARLKRAKRLWTKRHRRFVLTTKADPGHVCYANVLDRRFKNHTKNRMWVGDVTCVWTFEGWLYLAVMLDLYSRRIIGWSMGPNCNDELTVGALEMAIGAYQKFCVCEPVDKLTRSARIVQRTESPVAPWQHAMRWVGVAISR